MRGYMKPADPDGDTGLADPRGGTAIEGRMVLNAQLPMAPIRLAGARSAVVRPAVSLAGGVRSDAAPLRGGGRATSAPRFSAAAACGAASCPRPRRGSSPRRRGAGLEHARVRVRPGRDARVLATGRRGRARPGGPGVAARGALRSRRCRTMWRGWRRCRRRPGRPGTPEPPSVRIVHDGASVVARGRRCAGPGWSCCAIRTTRPGAPRWTACRPRSSGSTAGIAASRCRPAAT